MTSLISCDDDEKVTQLHSYPEWQPNKFLNPNDNSKSFYLFHFGHLSENLLSKRVLKSATLPKSMPHEFHIGGVAILSSYLKVIKDRFQEQAVFISHGGFDFFKSDKVKKNLITATLKEIPLDALLLSKNDIINTGTKDADFLKSLPWYNSNILSIKTGEPTDIFDSEGFKVLKTPKLSLGLIGSTSYKTLSPVERNEISGFYFQDPVTTILRTKNQLSKAGVDLIALYYEGPIVCEQALLNRALPFKELPKLEDVCQKDSELLETLKRLPPDSIDLVFTNSKGFAGVNHQGIPILSLHSPAEYIQGIKLVVKPDKKGSKIDWGKSFLLESVKLCHQVFVGTHDCVFDIKSEDLNEDRFDLMEKTSFGVIKARFLGHEISEDPVILKALNDR